MIIFINLFIIILSFLYHRFNTPNAFVVSFLLDVTKCDVMDTFSVFALFYAKLCIGQFASPTLCLFCFGYAANTY